MIESDYEEKYLIHFFIHFNLGVPFDNVYSDILKIENKDFKLIFNLKLQAFIKESLTNIGPELWKAINIDERVLKVIRYVEVHLNQKLSNTNMSSLANVAPYSIARLFKEEINITLHNFIQNRKIA